MADAKFEEVIRLAFETAGTDGIKQAATAIVGMGDVSEEARQKAAALLDDIGSAEKAGAAARQYEQVGKQVLEYQRQISAARSKVLELAAAVKATDEPTKAQQRELAKARSTLSDLVGEQQRELGTLRTLKVSLDGQGISTRNAASAQKDLAARTATASANLRDMVTSLKATRDADARLQAELAAASAKARTEAQQYDAALKALRSQIDNNKHAAREGADEAVAGLDETRHAASRLKGMLATVAGYFSLSGMVAGIKRVIAVSSEAEQQVGQLNAVLTSTGHAAGYSADQLLAMANGVSRATKFTTAEVVNAQVRLLSYTDIVGKEFPQALQIVMDQSARLGISVEQSAEVVGKALQTPSKAMEALGKQGFKLTEDQKLLLRQFEATGESAKAQAVIMDILTESYGGAAAAQKVGTIAGLWKSAQDSIEEFIAAVGNAGTIDYLKNSLAELLAKMRGFAADGSLQRWARQTSDAIIGVVDAVRRGTLFLVDHAEAIANIVKVYATFKVARLGAELALAANKFIGTTIAANAAAAAIDGAGVKAGFLGRQLRRIPGGIKIAIAVIGFDLLVKAGNYIGELAGKHSEAAKNLEATQARVNRQIRAQAEAYMEVERQYARYFDTQVLGADEVARMTKAERASYASRLDGLRAYLSAKQSEQFRLQHLGEITQEELDKTRAAVKSAKDGVEALQKGTELAAAALQNKLSISAQVTRDKLQGIGGDAAEARDRIEKLFDAFPKQSITQIGDMALAIANVAAESQGANTALAAGLRDTLAKLSSTDLLRFQSAASAAFGQYKVGAADAAVITETVLQSALQRLGVASELWGLKSTDAARQNVAAFETVAENAAATAGTIEAAFNKALANATTIEAVKDLGTAMQVAGDQGKVGFDATERAAAAVQNRIRSLQTALDPLNAAFSQLGITSKRSLDDAAAAARTSFDQIVRAYRGGGAAIEDVRAAFGAYAKTQLDAAANSDDWKQASVRNALEVQAATLSVSDEMAKLGLSGLDAGDKVAHGARTATNALRTTAGAAGEVAAATDRAGDSAEAYGDKSRRAADSSATAWVASGKRSSVALTGLSDNFLQALSSLNKYIGSQNIWRNAWNATVAEWRRQGAEVDKQIESLSRQNAAFDELTQRVETLRKTYNYLNDDQLRALAQAQQTLEQNQKRAEDEAKQKAQDQREKNAAQNAADTERWNKELGIDPNASPAKPGAGAGPQRIAIDLSVSASQQAGAVPAQLSPTDVQKVANEVVRQIGIARTMSNR